MASQAAYKIEQLTGHTGDAVVQQDISNYETTGDNTKTMKALVWQGKNKVEVVTTARPKLVENRDVILKVTGSTLCGSDLHLLHGSIIQLNKGDILGHEFCGVVDEIGSEVKGIKKGGRYVASFQIACGDCFYCKQGLSSQCERSNTNTAAHAMYGGQMSSFFGYSHFTGGFAGGQAEYVRVPLGDVNLLAIPDDVPDEKALYLSDVLATSYNAVKDTGVYKDDEVAIFGAGPIGQMAGIFSVNEGASKVIYVDTEPRLSQLKSKWPAEHQSKLELVDYKTLSFGVTSKPTVVSKLKELCGGRGPDVALECAAGEYPKGWMHTIEIALGAETDTSEIINEMVESVRSYGRCGITGVYTGYTNHFNIGSLMERGIRLIGNGQAPVHKYWKELLQQIQTGKIDPLQMVSHRIILDDLDTVYTKFDNHEDGLQKIFVETKHSFPRCEGSPEVTRF